MSSPSPRSATAPSFFEAFRFWLKLGFVSFGGPTGQIAIMHAELVENKRWIGEDRFLHALNYCMLLPGPEAQQLATYCGWLLHRAWGGIVAGALFVLPSAFILWALSYAYVAHGQVGWIAAVFYGLKPAVLAIVAAAVIRIGRKALKTRAMWGIAILSFIAIFIFKAPFPAIVAGAALLGYFGGRHWPAAFDVMKGHGANSDGVPRAVIDDAESVRETRPTMRRAVGVTALCLVVWWAPLFAVVLWLGSASTLAQEGFFFSKAALVTFGGAYAVLPYVAQQAVEQYRWLSAPQMVDGLALAETTPGPLIMVLQFVGFLGAWHHPGGLSPLASATLGAAITTWVTFVPSFLFIFLGAPYIERLRGAKTINYALSAVTAAVVGVVLNLAVWFGWQVLRPAAGQWDWFATVVALTAFAAIQRFKLDAVPVVLVCGGLGLVWRVLAG